MLKLVIMYQQHIIDYSVSQDSVAGPQFFNINASTLFDIIQEDTDINSFADDHTIHNAYNPQDKYECMSAMHSL